MKRTLLIALITAFSFHAFAENFGGDATPTKGEARKLAFLHAVDNVFADLLDHDSSVYIRSNGKDEGAYIFLATMRNFPKICSVVVRVSKHNGAAFNEQEPTCTFVRPER